MSSEPSSVNLSILGTRRVFLSAVFGRMMFPFDARADQASVPRLIKIVAPVSVGAAFDVTARLLAKELASRLGCTVIVEDRPGAGGTIGTRAVVNSAPDGATLLLAGQGMISIAPNVMPNLGFDPVAGLIAVSPLAIMRGLLVVPADTPYQSLAEIVEAGKSGKLSFGSGGNGTGSHLMGEMLNARARTRFQHVPYQGISPLIIGLMTNQVQLGFVGAVDSMPLIKSGKLRALASSTTERDWQLPSVPTLKEAGYGDDWLPYWVALFAPAATPGPVIQALRAAMAAIRQDAATVQAMKDLGMTQDTRTIEEFIPVAAKDSAAVAKLVKTLNPRQ